MLLVEKVDGGRADFVGEPVAWEGELLVPPDLIHSANSRVELRGARASRACPTAEGFAGMLIREEIGMCLGDSTGLLRPREVTSPVARDETDAVDRDESSPGGAVLFKNSARSEVSAVSERGIGRSTSGNFISLTLLGVRV